MTLLSLTCTSICDPKPSCGAILGRRVSSQLRAEYLNGLLVSAPTGHKSIILPESSELTLLSTYAVISECSPRPTIPNSIMPPTSCKKRTQRVH